MSVLKFFALMSCFFVVSIAKVVAAIMSIFCSRIECHIDLLSCCLFVFFFDTFFAARQIVRFVCVVADFAFSFVFVFFVKAEFRAMIFRAVCAALTILARVDFVIVFLTFQTLKHSTCLIVEFRCF